MQKEIWKDIPVYKGHYQASNLGRIRSIKFKNVKIISPFNIKGYLAIKTCVGSVRKTRMVHQLVAMAFLGHNPNGHDLVVDHIDECKTNNKLENLQIITNRENINKSNKHRGLKYTGVKYNKRNDVYCSYIKINGKSHYLGSFKTPEEAQDAYFSKIKTI